MLTKLLQFGLVSILGLATSLGILFIFVLKPSKISGD